MVSCFCCFAELFQAQIHVHIQIQIQIHMHIHVSVRVRLCLCVCVACVCVLCVCFCVCMFEKSFDTDVQIVRYTWRRGRKTKANHLTAGSLQRFPPNNWSLTASTGKVNDWGNRDNVVLNLFSNIKCLNSCASDNTWAIHGTDDEG